MKNILEGIFTGGDLMRFVLEGGDLNLVLGKAMNSTPITFLCEEEVVIYSYN